MFASIAVQKLLGKLHAIQYNVIQCNSAMRVAGAAVLSFGAVIVRTSHTNLAGVWIVRPTHAKIFATILLHLLIVRGSTKCTVSNVCS